MVPAMDLLWSLLVVLLGFACRVSSVVPPVQPAPISANETDMSDAHEGAARPVAPGWMIHGLVVNKIPLAARGDVPLQWVVTQTAGGGRAFIRPRHGQPPGVRSASC